MRPPTAFRWVRDRAAQINGIADATMTRDEGWQFLVLGRSIERADMTSRLVATASLTVGQRPGAPRCGRAAPTRRSCAPTRASRPSAAPPSSCCSTGCSRGRWSSASTAAERCLDNLESAGQRAGFQNEAQRLLGRTRAELEYRSLSDVVADLPNEMERLQRTCALATDAITRRYFAGAEATDWHGVRA